MFKFFAKRLIPFFLYICQEFVDGDEFVMHVLACFDLDIIRFLNQTFAHELDSNSNKFIIIQC